MNVLIYKSSKELQGNLVELTTNDLMNYVDEMIEELEDKIFN